MADPIAVTFDVTDALPADAVGDARATIAGWLFLPPKPLPPESRPTVMVLTAGGSYDKRYHHAVIPGHPGYSAAEHLSMLGNIVLLTDHLGVGESSRLPDQKRATRFVVARANHEAASQLFARLAEGTLHRSLPAIRDFIRIGGGHSMGGMMTIVQQARHRTYDGVMIMGYTADSVYSTINGQKLRMADFLPQGDYPDYSSPDRSSMHENFHWKDVPAAVVAGDDALAAETPTSIGFDSIRTGIVREEAGQIDVPVYICLGEQDVSPDPHAEPAFYRASNDVTLHLLPRSAHCQTFASTRHQMWNRMHRWSQAIADSDLRASACS